MESSTHDERQHRCVWFEFMSTIPQKVEFILQKQLCDLQLVIVAEAVEDNLFCDASKELGAECLLGTSQDMTLHRSETGVLKAQQIRATDVGGEHDIESGEVKGFAIPHRDP